MIEKRSVAARHILISYGDVMLPVTLDATDAAKNSCPAPSCGGNLKRIISLNIETEGQYDGLQSAVSSSDTIYGGYIGHVKVHGYKT